MKLINYHEWALFISYINPYLHIVIIGQILLLIQQTPLRLYLSISTSDETKTMKPRKI